MCCCVVLLHITHCCVVLLYTVYRMVIVQTQEIMYCDEVQYNGIPTSE